VIGKGLCGEGLFKDLSGALGSQFFFFFRVIGAGEKSHREIAQFRRRFDIAHYFLSRYRRHLHIQQDEIWNLIARSLDRAGRIGKSNDLHVDERLNESRRSIKLSRFL